MNIALGLGLLLGAIGWPAAAQDEVQPLLDMLRFVPAPTIASDSLVTYVDYRAVEAARPGAGMPHSYEAWTALDDDSLEQWLAAFKGVISSSPGFLEPFPSMGGDWPALLGFDFFDADRELRFGAPPEDGLIVSGRFEPAAIAAAHEARGFVSTDEVDRTLICSAAGCEEGLAVDLTAREPADPFGGTFGRHQPLLVSTDTLLSSAAIDTVRSMQAAATGAGSLAEAADVRTALAALPAGPRLLQATFVSPRAVSGDGSATEEPSSVPTLRPYELALFADTTTTTQQVAHVVLVYASSADAHAAAEILPARIDGIVSLAESGTLREQLEQRGLTALDIRVFEPSDGSGAAVDVALHAPLAGAEATSADEASSSLYRLLMTMLFRRDARWLAAPVA